MTEKARALIADSLLGVAPDDETVRLGGSHRLMVSDGGPAVCYQE